MLSIVETSLFERLCDDRVLSDDLALAPEARTLLVHADDLVAPVVLDIPERQNGEAVEQLIFEGLGGDELATVEGAAGYPSRPTRVAFLTALETTPDAADSYGQRLRAILVPPSDGDYSFWVAADDQASLRLSADDGAEGLVEIASVAEWTKRYQWDRDASQQSAPIRLEAGKRYLIEVLHKEGAGGDHLAVAWSGPGIARSVIGADVLEPAPFSIDPEASVNAIRQNLVHLHEHLLGERLDPADAEIERTYQLFKAVYENAEPADPALAEPYCENRNGSTPGRRAWNAVLTYLTSDFRYLND